MPSTIEMSLDEIIAAQKQQDKAGPRRVRTNIIRSVVYPIRAPREGFRWRGGNAHFSVSSTSRTPHLASVGHQFCLWQ